VVAGLETSHKIGILVAAGIFIAFALLSSFVFPKMNPDFPGKRLGWFIAASIGLTVLMLGTIIVLAKEPKETGKNEAAAAVDTTANETPQAPTTTSAPKPPAATGDAAAGKAVFASAGCVSCHTLKDAGATGTVGPNLDDAKPPASLVVDRVTNGKGVMPSFKGQLSAKQIQDVAAYVSSVAGK
jgi:mono/diheme cytochrome c family protein